MTTLDRYSSVMMSAYGKPPVVLVKGEGVHVWDDAGTRYLDCLAGVACVGLGHSHPAVAETISRQARTLGHVSNLFATTAQIELAERLSGWLGHGTKVFFTNSGSESNEGAFKLTRLTGRTKIVAAEGSFHGRTMGALALTWTEKYRHPFEPLPGEVVWVPYSDEAALAEAVDDSTAAIVLEPIQGESGVLVPDDGYLARARAIADEHHALLWMDEVQTGMGRTGAWFAHTLEGIVPDIVTLAKALGNGFPIGAVLATGRAADFFQPGSHGSTFGGNALAATVGLTVIDQIEPLLGQVADMGAWFAEQLRCLPGVVEVRGRGLMLGVGLEDRIAAGIVKAGLAHGVILNAPRDNTIRLIPPLIITQDDVAPLLEVWPTLVKEAHRG
ncbi:MAG: acetylornithine transaminase [Propionibacteriaceae bacterium]|nr:acetylornithine transaminase [Propionibacteriaceae bacterium]